MSEGHPASSRLLAAISRRSRQLPHSRSKVRAGRLLSRGIGRNRVVLANAGGRRYVLDPRSRTEAEMLWNGQFDPEVVDVLRAACGPGSVFVDIGANVGLVLTQMLGFVDRCVAFEPMPVNFERLRWTVELNGASAQVACHNVALGEETGWLELVKEGPAGVSDNAIPRSALDGGEVTQVPVRRLDDVLRDDEIDRVDAIKIDVEGLEVSVLRGASETIQRHRPVVFGEFNNLLMPRLGTSFDDAWRLFAPLGYRACSFLDDRTLTVRDPPPANLGNVVLVPEEKVDDLRRQGYDVRSGETRDG